MTTAEERMRILEMVQEGKISAEEGAKLLQALRQSEAQHAPAPPPPRAPRMLRVRITDMKSGRTKVNVNIPLSLVNVGIKLGARIAPNNANIDYDGIMQAIREGASGVIADVEDLEKGEHVEVWVE